MINKTFLQPKNLVIIVAAALVSKYIFAKIVKS